MCASVKSALPPFIFTLDFFQTHICAQILYYIFLGKKTKMKYIRNFAMQK